MTKPKPVFLRLTVYGGTQYAYTVGATERDALDRWLVSAHNQSMDTPDYEKIEPEDAVALFGKKAMVAHKEIRKGAEISRLLGIRKITE